jgi:hypothetical protein
MEDSLVINRVGHEKRKLSFDTVLFWMCRI